LKKFNKDISGFTISFDTGGVPVFNDDLKNMELNTTLSGVYSTYKGYNVVLSGCLITNVNTTLKTCNMSSGLVLIDDIIYKVEALTNQAYPFSIINGTMEDDNRGFKNGVYHTVATTYNYSIRNNFVFADAADYYPNNISTSEIYFDPFCAQRKEYVDTMLSTKLGDISLTSSNTTVVTKDEYGENISGTLNFKISNDYLKWKYLCYKPITIKGKLGLGYTAGISGSDLIMLNSNNLPSHTHDLNPANATTNVGDSSHRHEFENAFFSELTVLLTDTYKAKTYSTSQFGTSLINNLGSMSTDINNTPAAFRDMTYNGGTHTHGVLGRTESNSTLSENVDVQGLVYGVTGYQFVGLPTVFSFDDISSSTGQRVCAYKWWKDDVVKYTNM
jgi:hypothetical protein